jgi:hypothetical protein
MQKFIHQKNLELYRKRLAETTDVEEREMLAKLLTEEEAKDPQPADGRET